MKYKYFVVFLGDNDGIRNDIIEFDFKISSKTTLEASEKIIENQWFGDGRSLTLLNYQLIYDK